MRRDRAGAGRDAPRPARRSRARRLPPGGGRRAPPPCGAGGGGGSGRGAGRARSRRLRAAVPLGRFGFGGFALGVRRGGALDRVELPEDRGAHVVELAWARVPFAAPAAALPLL